MDMWDSIRRPNTHIIGVPEGEKIRQENVFEEMMAKSFSNCMKVICRHMSEIQSLVPDHGNQASISTK